jgi:hypothetical protein
MHTFHMLQQVTYVTDIGIKAVKILKNGKIFLRRRTSQRIRISAAELNPSAQRCLTRYFTGDFASSTVHFVNICVKNQQIHQLFIQFINYVS